METIDPEFCLRGRWQKGDQGVDSSLLALSSSSISITTIVIVLAAFVVIVILIITYCSFMNGNAPGAKADDKA